VSAVNAEVVGRSFSPIAKVELINLPAFTGHRSVCR